MENDVTWQEVEAVCDENAKAMEVEKKQQVMDFWQERIADREHPASVRCKGIHYVIGPDVAGMDKRNRGFGGRKFRIEFTDGREGDRVVETTNLWCQGSIPLEYQNELPDNATIEVRR